MNVAACCTWRGEPQWRQLALAYWGGPEHCTPAKMKRYRRAFATVSPQGLLVCLISQSEQVPWAVFYALLAKRLVRAEVQLVVTHHTLFARVLQQLDQLQCPPGYSTMTDMLPVHLLPLEYLYLSLEFPQSSQMCVWCDEVGWAAVQLIRPHARRWGESMGPGSALVVHPEQGHWQWLLHDASALA